MRPAFWLPQNAIPAFCQFQNMTPVFMFQNVSPTFFNNAKTAFLSQNASSALLKNERSVFLIQMWGPRSTRDPHFWSKMRDPHSTCFRMWLSCLWSKTWDSCFEESSANTWGSCFNKATRDLHSEWHVFETYKAKSPHPQGFEASSLDVPSTDLRNYLTRKRSIHQITPQCHYKRLISAVLLDCHCDFQITKPSIFSRLSVASHSAKRRWSERRSHSLTTGSQK